MVGLPRSEVSLELLELEILLGDWKTNGLEHLNDLHSRDGFLKCCTDFDALNPRELFRKIEDGTVVVR